MNLEAVLGAVGKMNDNWLILLGMGVFLSVYVLKKFDIFPKKVLAGISVLIGMILGFCVTWMTGNNIPIGIYDGFIAGLIASGGYDLIKLLAAIFSGKIKDWNTLEDLLDDGKINGSNK